MTQAQKPGIGNETVVEVNATAANETILLPSGFATGRKFTVRRIDSGASGHTVTVTVAAGQYLDDTLNGTLQVAGNTEGWLSQTDPGLWQSYGLAATSSSTATGVARAFTGLIGALNMGQTTAISAQGDSTGDSNGGAGGLPEGERLIYRMLQKLAPHFPNHHVITKLWNDTTQDYGTWNVLQAQAAGRRYAACTTRSLRYVPTVAQVTPGIIDLRALIAPNQWSGAAVNQTIIYRGRTAANTTDAVFHWRLNASGLLELGFSQDGTAIGSFRQSSVAASTVGVNGQPMWVRVTLEITPTVNYAFKFYTSPAADGVTWTQLGTTQTFTGSVVMNPSTASFYEVGASGWQPSSSGFIGKIYEVQIRNGLNGPTQTPCCLEQWQPYGDPSTTFGGAPTLYLINGSRSGQNMVYFADSTRLPLMTQDYGQSVHIFNDGHNEAGNSGPTDWEIPYLAWVAAVAGRLPRAVPVVVGQNPHTAAWANETAYGYEHQRRVKELAALAGSQNWTYADVYSAFAADPRGVPALILPDGLHPNDLGYELGALTLLKKLGYSS